MNHDSDKIKVDTLFVYHSKRDLISIQALVNISQNEHYVQGWCIRDEHYKTFRLDRILKECESEEEALKFIETLDVESYESKPHPRETFDVHFTGFKKADKAELTNVAQDVGMIVRKEVTKYLNLLCYGYNAGPKKLDKARSQGVIIINEPQFKHFVETGEIPES